MAHDPGREQSAQRPEAGDAGATSSTVPILAEGGVFA